jgi:hypothetical protein
MRNLVIGKNVMRNVRFLQGVSTDGRLHAALAALRRFNTNEYILQKPLA